MIHSTDFREYPCGKLPGDMTERWATGTTTRIEAAPFDLSHRNVLRLTGGSATGARQLVTWDAIDSDTGKSNQAEITLFRPVAVFTGDLSLASPVLRASGDAGAENGYRLMNLIDGTSLKIQKLTAGVSSDLGMTTITPVRLGGYYYCWFESFLSGGTHTIRVKIWRYGESIPGSWNISANDASSPHTDGWMGWLHYYSAAKVEIPFCSFATNLDTPELESAMPETIEVWLKKPDEEVNYTAKFSHYDPETDSTVDEWVTHYPMSLDIDDYPSQGVFTGQLRNVGSRADGLLGDVHLEASQSPERPFILKNNPTEPDGNGPFDHWRTKSFRGRPAELRIGPVWREKPTAHNGVITHGVRSPHRDYQVIDSLVHVKEPDIRLSDGEVIVSGGKPSLVTTRLPVYRHVGIATGVKALTLSGGITAPAHASYDVTSFNVYLRVRVPAAGVTGTGFSSLLLRQIDSTHRQFHVALYQASHALANRIHFLSYDALGNAIITLIGTTRYNVDRWIPVIFSVKASDRWYALIDGIKVGEGTLSTAPTNGSTAAVNMITTGAGLSVCDVRIEQWAPEHEALARFSTVKEPDTINISMFRCNDNSGTVVTDYNTATANHAALLGVLNTDSEWTPTYLGGPEIAGSPMPITGGIVYNVEAPPIDSVREIFRYTDRARTTGTDIAIRAKGLTLTPGANYTEPTDGAGTVDIVGASDQPITIRTTPTAGVESTSIHVPQLVADELMNRGVVTHATLHYDSFLALAKMFPFKGGYRYTDAPPLADFLRDNIGRIGGFYSDDRSGRIYASALMKPVNPTPYGQRKVMEFLGYQSGAVVFTEFALPESASHQIGCIFKSYRTLRDLSTSTLRGMPTGQTLMDRLNYAGTAGYYLGISGLADGQIVFGHGGVASTSTGLNYLLSPAGKIKDDTWYLVLGRFEQSPTLRRSIYLINLESGEIETIATEFTTSGYVPANTANIPLSIGGGYNGGFCGAMMNVQIWGNALVTSPISDQATTPAWDEVSSPPSGLNTWIPLSEGEGDFAYDLMNSDHVGRVLSVRHSPRITLEWPATLLESFRHLIPAWRTEAQYRFNHNLLSGANVAGGVSGSDRIALGARSLSASIEHPEIAEDYADSRDLIVPTPLDKEEHARYIATLLDDRVDVTNSVLVIRALRYAMLLSLGDEILLRLETRWDETNSQGYTLRVVASVGPEIDGDIPRFRLDLWGDDIEQIEALSAISELLMIDDDDLLDIGDGDGLLLE